MKKKILSLVLALVLCLGLLPAAASAAEADLPDWYFLFAIFENVDADGKDKDGIQQHTKYAMPQDEIDAIHDHAQAFEEYMNQVELMCAHVDVVEIDAPITKLGDYEGGSWFSPEEVDILLKDKVDLDQYDHVFAIISLNISTTYAGLTGAALENGTGYSCVHFKDREDCLENYPNGNVSWLPTLYVHEFIHFTEQLSQRLGEEFNLHETQEIYDSRLIDGWKACYTDTLLNRVQGNAETGTGVNPNVWQYSPRVYRSTSEWTIPSSVTGIGAYAFQKFPTLTKVTIPGSITEVTKYAFYNCNNLKEVTISSGATSIGEWAFGCDDPGSLTTVTIPVSVTSIEYAAFWNSSLKDVYYGGTEEQWKAIQIGEFNESLTEANIHYTGSTTPTQPAKSETASPTNDKLEVNGTAANPTVYKIGDSNYFKIRDVAALLNGTEKQFAVGYDGTKNAVTATTGQGYAKQTGDLAGAATGGNQSAETSNDAIYVDSQKIEAEVYKINGSNYFKLRDLGKALNFYVGWSAERGMYIETDKPYSE
ncbi:leucine-rich repeat protein [Flintibacter muris]|uniref:leucine-rich repeat protein n=1 Tax=Flintibacter muris TaxID=2941327 RepID=UPI00203ECD8E|nr:leucine-rich repeat protein [Flintibacter muris]